MNFALCLAECQLHLQWRGDGRPRFLQQLAASRLLHREVGDSERRRRSIFFRLDKDVILYSGDVAIAEILRELGAEGDQECLMEVMPHVSLLEVGIHSGEW